MSVSADLVRRLVAGEATAARELWDTYAPRVRGLVWRLVGNAADTDDLVQEVFIGIYRGIGNLRDPDALDSYVLTVAANHARTALRRAARDRRRTQALADAAVTEVHHPSHDARRALARVQEILDDLSPELRIAFVLRNVEGLELTQVAESMGWSLATTKRRLRKARDLVLTRARRDADLLPYLERMEGA